MWGVRPRTSGYEARFVPEGVRRARHRSVSAATVSAVTVIRANCIRHVNRTRYRVCVYTQRRLLDVLVVKHTVLSMTINCYMYTISTMVYSVVYTRTVHTRMPRREVWPWASNGLCTDALSCSS